MSRVPLVDLGLQRDEVAAEVEAGWARVLRDTAFIQGEEVGRFEVEYAHLCDVRHCIGVANGTDAIELALRALGIGAGDEVILPANTFIATALAVVRTGAAPVLVDSDPVHHLIDVSKIEEKIGPRTRALLPVDLYGQVAEMETIESIARAARLKVVEDAAQSQGASRRGRRAGGFGDIAATSFYPGKNLGAYGDAGAVVTDDDALAAQVRRLGGYGSERKYHHPEKGFNSRLDTLQAVVLRAKLRRLAGWNEARREAAAHYDDLLKELPDVTTPRTLDGNEHVFHLYVVRVPERDRVLAELGEEGIGAGVHYPVPIHLQGAFADLGQGPGSFPEAERAADEILSLPLYPGITRDQQELVVDVLARALRLGP